MNKEIKLFRFLSILSKKEFKQLQQAVESPLYNTTTPAKKLYLILQKQYPDFDSSPKGKEKIFTKLFPEKSYNDLDLRRAFSDLTQTVKKFIAYKELQNDSWEKGKILTEIYEEMYLSNLAEKEREALHQAMDKKIFKNEFFWKKKVLLLSAEQAAIAHEDNQEKIVILAEEVNHAADCFFAFATIRHALIIKSKAFIFKIPYNLRYLEAVKEANRSGLLANDSLFRLYILALQLIENQRDDLFFAYQNLFFKQVFFGYGRDDFFLFKLGLNYATRQLRRNKNEFQQISLDWYKFGLDKDILIVDNLIKPIDFSNIVILGCKNKEINWTINFIEEYTKWLPIEFQAEEATYSKALIFFEEKKFDKVIENLSEYTFSQIYILKSKNLVLKCHFELYLKDATYHQMLFSKIRAFESYLTRDKKMTKLNKLPYLNSCKILKKIIKLRIKNTKKALINKKIMQELKVKKVVISKGWIIEKIS